MENLKKENFDEIGCLLSDLVFDAGNYKVHPNSHFSKNIALSEKHVNSDGFLYPPLVNKYRIDSKTKKTKKIPNSERPANIHRVISTHLIQRKDGTDLSPNFRLNEGALILRILGVLYETSTQFWDWWWVGRIHLDKDEFKWINKPAISELFIQAFNEWEKWDSSVKIVFLNCCFNFSRSLTYEWDYERFTFLYICIDAIWWISENQYGIKNIGGHGNRINTILEHFHLHTNKGIVKDIVDIRHNLFHQGLWGLENPMSGLNNKEYQNMRYLHEIVKRCILRIIGIKSPFIQSNWENFKGWRVWDR
ncbi:MAG: hypothetical protein V1739_06965 [Candidatus Omnitrophota bacterium]